MDSVAGCWTSAQRTDSVSGHQEARRETNGASNGLASPGPRSLTPGPGPLTPKEASRLRILDPACGSGSFLIGAYQYLLDWHLNWYTTHNPEKWARKKTPPIYQTPGPRSLAPDPRPLTPGHRLTTSERKRILLNNIYGVDIDPQAVEVTKLSLLLKVLEGENEETLERQLKFFHERALPDLGSNIKCGNSLIGPDFYDNQQMTFLDEEERYRINAFDWNAEFPQIMKSGGFDAVIGNPPYVRTQALKQWAPEHLQFFKQRYNSAASGNYDIYVVFIERGLGLLKAPGRLGLIVPHKFFNAKYGQPVRELLAKGRHLSHVVHFGDQQVFPGATTYTCLLFLDKAGADRCRFVGAADLRAWRTAGRGALGDIPAASVTQREWNFVVGPGATLFRKLADMEPKLDEFANIFVGLQTSADPVFLFKDYDARGPAVEVFSKQLAKRVQLEPTLLKPVVRSGSIGRFWARPSALVLFPYIRARGELRLIAEDEMQQRFPRTWEYLCANKKVLSAREHGKFAGTGWYQLYPKNLDLWERPKIMVPYMVTRLSAFYDDGGNYFVNVTTGGFGLTIRDQGVSLKYVTGLLNGQLLDWFIRRVSTTFHGGYFAANKQFLAKVPMRRIDFASPPDSARHDRMVELVERMLELHNKLAAAKTAHEKTVLQREIETTDRQIDQLVYELYGLTEEEIKIVEETTKRGSGCIPMQIHQL